MSGLLLALVPVAPLLAAFAAPFGPRRAAAAAALAGLPAIAVALGVEAATLPLPWLLLGAEFGVDALRRPLLLLAGLLWLLAAAYAGAYHRHDPRPGPLFLFFALTMAGNLGLIVAFDAISFYLFFILMNLAAYGLIRHIGDAEARRAARVYIVLVVLGEAFLLPALWAGGMAAESLALADLRAAVADHPLRGLILVCLFLGFGIKAGALPLHVWLPLAHPVAPTPASAVLSGVMIKAGLLAWLVFLPVGAAALPGWGLAWIVLGLAAAFYGAVIGLLQRRPKTILAYSSISQMGLMTVIVGLALTAPAAAPVAAGAAALYATHHGLAKGALFLGVALAEHGRAGRRAALALLLLPALTLAGLPPTTGLVAKAALKEAAAAVPAWAGWLEPALSLAAVGTTLILARFLVVLGRSTGTAAEGAGAGLWAPWLAALAAVAVVAWLPPVAPPDLAGHAFTTDTLIGAAWPAALGIGLAALAWAFGRRRSGPSLPVEAVPPGDLLALIEPPMRGLIVAGRLAAGWAATIGPVWSDRALRLAGRVTAAGTGLEAGERRLARWTVLVGAFTAILAAIALLTATG